MEKEETWRWESPFGLRRYGSDFIAVACDALEAYRKRQPELNDPTYSSFSRQQLLEIAPDPIYYNFLHGVELGLKSYLLHAGTRPLEKIRKHFGHDLSRLLDETLKLDLRSQCPQLTDTHIEAIRFSSELYRSKQLEYIRIGAVQSVPIDQVAEAAKTLIGGLKRLPMRTAHFTGQERKTEQDIGSR